MSCGMTINSGTLPKPASFQALKKILPPFNICLDTKTPFEKLTLKDELSFFEVI